MKRIFFILMTVFVLSISSMVMGANIPLSWDAPTENTDGSPVTDLAGFKVHHGLSSGNYDTTVDVGNVLTYITTGLEDGTHYFAITAYDTSGNESAYSNEVNKLTNDIMNPPFLHEIVVTIKNGVITKVVINKIEGGK